MPVFSLCFAKSPIACCRRTKRTSVYRLGADSICAPSQAAFDHSGKMVTRSVMADGSIVAEHNGSLGNVTVARLGPDGKVETFCTTDAVAARSWMAGELGRRAVTSLNTPVADK